MAGYRYKDEDLALFRLLTEGFSDSPVVPTTPATGALNQLATPVTSFGSSGSSSYRPTTDTGEGSTPSSSGSWQSLGLPSILATGGGALTKLAGAYAGIPSLITSPMSAAVKAYLGDTTASDMKRTVGDATLNTALSTMIPGIGIPLSLLGMTGFSLTRGLGNLVNPNTEVPESWRGGFWDKGYEPPAGGYVSSGNSNYSPYGGGSYSEPSPNTQGYDSGHSYGSTGYGPTSNSDSDSSSDSSSSTSSD